MLDRLRIRWWRLAVAEDARLETGLGAAEEGGVVLHPMWMRHSVAGHDVDALGRAALQPRQALCIDAHLDDRGRFHAPRELGVGDLVAPGPQVAGHLDADQEVGVTAPATWVSAWAASSWEGVRSSVRAISLTDRPALLS